jgi:hypothetical protein
MAKNVAFFLEKVRKLHGNDEKKIHKADQAPLICKGMLDWSLGFQFYLILPYLTATYLIIIDI